MRRGDPIGQWLGRFLTPIFDRYLHLTEQETREALEQLRRDDPLVRLGMTHEPPELWKSLLFWFIVVVGGGLSFYIAFHRR